MSNITSSYKPARKTRAGLFLLPLSLKIVDNKDTMEKIATLGLMVSSTDSEYEKEIIEGISSYCTKYNQKLIIFSGRSLSWPYGWEYQKTAIYEHIHKGTIDVLIVASGTLCNYTESLKQQ